MFRHMNEEDYYGPGLVSRREEVGLSRHTLSSMTGIPINTIRRYETGERKPCLSHLVKIENVMNAVMEMQKGR